MKFGSCGAELSNNYYLSNWRQLCTSTRSALELYHHPPPMHPLHCNYTYLIIRPMVKLTPPIYLAIEDSEEEKSELSVISELLHMVSRLKKPSIAVSAPSPPFSNTSTIILACSQAVNCNAKIDAYYYLSSQEREQL
ncbi:hypothetical protein TWF106_002306 [Orbilia oligospora]|uniref:Uncharacterized protein n=2 Tax=Orbilia oligospora TaxID=2813651 RepID=A0A7C8UG60_ORBOL|nr:hypothetical protein TWF106_002306 [Orbilia oligospora]